MKGEERERWKQFCEQAANEQDTERLMRLVAEISRLLYLRQQSLKPLGRTPSEK
jgi:hypothetical protein